jgi:hypothetical protein
MVATFPSLEAMDIFAFGLLAWTVVFNGENPLREIDLGDDSAENIRLLKRLKDNPLFVELAMKSVRAAEMCACGDIDSELFNTILEHTLRGPSTRKLQPVLSALQRYEISRPIDIGCN